jgi:hypothetical protein
MEKLNKELTERMSKALENGRYSIRIDAKTLLIEINPFSTVEAMNKAVVEVSAKCPCCAKKRLAYIETGEEIILCEIAPD